MPAYGREPTAPPPPHLQERPPAPPPLPIPGQVPSPTGSPPFALQGRAGSGRTVPYRYETFSGPAGPGGARPVSSPWEDGRGFAGLGPRGRSQDLYAQRPRSQPSGPEAQLRPLAHFSKRELIEEFRGRLDDCAA